MILFFDIETVANAVSEEIKEKYEKKYEKNYDETAGLMAEFSKVVCISFGYSQEGERKTKTFSGEDERNLLSKATEVFAKGNKLGGYNIINFDVPFLCKRYVINGLDIPKSINFSGKKPREIDVIDVMNIRKFGGMNAVSLDFLCYALEIESPKNNMNGSQVKNKSFQEIEKYCEKDVFATAEAYNKIIKSFIF